VATPPAADVDPYYAAVAPFKWPENIPPRRDPDEKPVVVPVPVN
jgi:hypothetical protein